MSRPGRKRNQSREKSGAPQREGIMDVMRPVLERRCRTMGWRTTDENLQRARDNRLDTLPGRMHVAGILSARAYDGLMEYAAAYANWLRAVDAPSPWPKTSAMGDAPARGSIVSLFDEEGHENSVRRAEGRYMAVEGVLIESCGKSFVLWAFQQPCEYTPADVPSAYVQALEHAGKMIARRVL